MRYTILFTIKNYIQLYPQESNRKYPQRSKSISTKIKSYLSTDQIACIHHINLVMEKRKYIHHNDKDRLYYLPEHFPLAPTSLAPVPLLNVDLNDTKNVMSVYGSVGFGRYLEGYVMLNNYPLKEVKICGKLVGETYKDFDMAGRMNKKNYIMVEVDDCSGINLTVLVKVRESLYLLLGLKFGENYGCHLAVCGLVSEYHKRTMVNAHAFEMLSRQTELDLEVDWWNHTLQYRQKVLLEPWVLGRDYVQILQSFNLVVLENEVQPNTDPDVISIHSEDDELEEIEIKTTVEDKRFELCLAIIFHFLNNRCENITLVDLLTNGYLLEFAPPNGIAQYFAEAIRELKEYGLLAMDNNEVICPQALHQLAIGAKLRLQNLKLQNQPFMLNEFLKSLKPLYSTKIDHKILNGIITWLLDYDLCDIGLWNYDSKEKSWTYAGQET